MREAEGGVADVENWLDGFVEVETGLDSEQGARNGRRWKRGEIVLELGDLLKGCESGAGSGSSESLFLCVFGFRNNGYRTRTTTVSSASDPR